jgi:hypothetical protein
MAQRDAFGDAVLAAHSTASLCVQVVTGLLSAGCGEACCSHSVGTCVEATATSVVALQPYLVRPGPSGWHGTQATGSVATTCTGSGCTLVSKYVGLLGCVTADSLFQTYRQYVCAMQIPPEIAPQSQTSVACSGNAAASSTYKGWAAHKQLRASGANSF